MSDIYKHRMIFHVKPLDTSIAKAKNYLSIDEKINAVKSIFRCPNNCIVKDNIRVWGLLDSKLYVERVLEKI